MNILYSPPTSEYVFDVDLEEESTLELGVGIIRDAHSEMISASSNEEARGVNFTVSLELEGKRRTLYQKYIAPPLASQERTFVFSDQSISIPKARQGSRLILKSEGGVQNFSFWYNPLIYRTKEKRRGIILISIDTLRADHLGCYGYSKATTPNIDLLSEDSSVFLNTYASSPWTLSSHVSIMTGLHCVNHQVYYDDERMDPSLRTLAQQLSQNGFLCSAFTGGGFVSAIYGFSKGFDNYKEGEGGVFKRNSAELIFQAASHWLEKNKNKDFFLFLHTYQTHNPYSCPPPYQTHFLEDDFKWNHIDLYHHLGGMAGVYKILPEDEKENVIGLYDGEILYVDEKLIKPLVDKLKALELYDQTMIIFTSDHGEEFGDHKGWGHRHSVYDESIKVPLIIKFPDSQHRGKRIDHIVNLVDIMPTILDLMKIDHPENEMDGKSLLSFLSGKERKDRTFLADIPPNLLNTPIPQRITMNKGRDKLILNRKFSEKDLGYFTSPPPVNIPVELFDLKNDPLERSSKADSLPELCNQILNQINEIYSNAIKRATSKVQIDDDLREQLKTLGYIR
jgi:arylsulfatase A-like enzyme